MRTIAVPQPIFMSTKKLTDTNFFEDGTKVKILSKIYAALNGRLCDFVNNESKIGYICILYMLIIFSFLNCTKFYHQTLLRLMQLLCFCCIQIKLKTPFSKLLNISNLKSDGLTLRIGNIL